MKRREFISLIGGAAAMPVLWPLAARAQQAIPVVGFLSGRSPTDSAANVAAFHKGLAEVGYVEGRNIHIQYRWADGRYDRLPALVADLIRRSVAVIAVFNMDSALAAKHGTTALPIVFATSADPVKFGLVASLNRPGGNLTGVSFLNSQLVAKQLEILHEAVPPPAVIALLVNPGNPNIDDAGAEAQRAALSIGRQMVVIKAATEADIDAAFTSLAQQGVGALLVGPDPFFDSRAARIIELAARHALPAIYPLRETVSAGGLMSYGTSITDAFRQVGAYTGRILKGEKPADLPVQQSTKIELVINLKTAKVLGLTVPLQLLARADEVIE
jgi:putative tryptophan/tyrosine transport system substrate-binding protein